MDLADRKLNRKPLQPTPPPAPTDAAPKTQIADYIAQMAEEMAAMSSAAGLPFLSHLLKLAKLEAELAAKAEFED
jgi:hypothetical protein